MKSFVDTSIRQFAVITIRTMPHCERLVISYADEKSLRDLLAGPSIVALGYSCRQEAEASLYGPVSQTSRNSVTTRVVKFVRDLKQSVLDLLAGKNNVPPRKSHYAISGLLQHAVVAAVVVLYSENALSAAVRAVISF